MSAGWYGGARGRRRKIGSWDRHVCYEDVALVFCVSFGIYWDRFAWERVVWGVRATVADSAYMVVMSYELSGEGH